MKKCITIVCLILAAGFKSTFAQGFTIERFASDITIHENSSLSVSESLYVNFYESKHGIFRVIPHFFFNSNSEDITTPLYVKGVRDAEGSAWNYDIFRNEYITEIKIGDADEYVEGRQLYVIEYKVYNAVRTIGDHDELFWNVTGNGWSCNIEQAVARINLDAQGDPGLMNTICFTGASGSQEKNCTGKINGSSAVFYASDTLTPGEGLTAGVSWRRGVVSHSITLAEISWYIDFRNNWPFALPFAVLVGMLIYWYFFGRDPKSGRSFTVRYKPPEINGSVLQPAETGVIIDERLDPADLYAEIVNLAVNGYIGIEEKGDEDIVFNRLKEPDEELNEFQKYLFLTMFRGKNKTVTLESLKKKIASRAHRFGTKMRDEIVNKRMLFSDDPISQIKKIKRRAWKLAFVYPIALLLGFLFLLMYTPIMFNPVLMWKLPAGIALCFFPVYFLAGLIPAKTRKGAEAMQQALEFEEFLDRADSDMIERLETTDLFYKYLPYAIALNVADNWADAFEGVFDSSPKWYSGSGAFSAGLLAGSLASAGKDFRLDVFQSVKRSSYSSSYKPSYRSSYSYKSSSSSYSSGGGFSGGGFSGGGFGGGGGGSW